MNKNAEIEALRGVAIVAVIISHLGNLAYWIPGLGPALAGYSLASGVDLFFVISGYVITRAFRAELVTAAARGSLLGAARGFMLRRFFRIMPAALVWLLVVCACSVWFNTTTIFGTLQGNFTDLLAVAFNLSNFHFANCITAGNPLNECGYNGIYWSISLEEQFYIIFPLLALLSGRIVVVLAVAVATWMTFHDRTILVWFTRVDGLVAGVCLAFASWSPLWEKLAPTFLRRWWARGLVVSVACALIVTMPQIAHDALPRLWPELIVLLCALLVAAAGYGRGFAFAPGLWRSALAYVGSRSFSLYLVHNVAAWLAREGASQLGLLATNQMPIYPASFIASALVLMVLMAEASYRLIEEPWRRWGRQIADLEVAKANEVSGAIGAPGLSSANAIPR